jgi:hypothetical protein
LHADDEECYGGVVDRVINVPPGFEEAFRQIAQLDSDRYARLLFSLSQEVASGSDAVERIIIFFSDAKIAGDVFSALSALAQYIEETNDSLEEASAAVAAGLANDDDVVRRRLTVRIAELISAPGVSVLAHAQSVLDAQEHILLSMRLFTTVRPVFNENPQELCGSVVYHELRIEYLDAKRKRCTFITALDGGKLDLLENQITRAREKEARVSQMLGDAGVSVYQLEARNDE